MYSCRKQGLAFICIGLALLGFSLSVSSECSFSAREARGGAELGETSDSVPLAGAVLCLPLVNMVPNVMEGHSMLLLEGSSWQGRSAWLDANGR